MQNDSAFDKPDTIRLSTRDALTWAVSMAVLVVLTVAGLLFEAHEATWLVLLAVSTLIIGAALLAWTCLRCSSWLDILGIDRIQAVYIWLVLIVGVIDALLIS